jgi:hypothetical protein
MTQTSTATQIFWTNPNTGVGIPCTVLVSSEDGSEHEIRLATGQEGTVTAGEIYTVDAYNQMGRYEG